MSSRVPNAPSSPTSEAEWQERIVLKFMQVRECSDAMAINSKLSLIDNLNKSVAENMSKVTNSHRTGLLVIVLSFS
eukprot:EC792924.1.p2 GENE.EC792924.1~~EC792924.1.p2  ORF type:complete len:89 (+),score=19.50 EC792924.1:41-268(+)